ncbi:OmpA family protein [Aurantiacibacter aquimixticola]|nr:OmpA family protein [Aurantiacibacter aquimixticola]
MKRSLWIAGATAMMATPAMAQDGPYVGVDGGAVLTQDTSVDIGNEREPVEIASDLGWIGAANAGYDWGSLRTELEGSYRSWSLDELTATARGIPTGGDDLETGTFALDGDASLASVMGNVLLDFGGDEGLGLSLGVGVGRTWLDIDASADETGPGYLDGNDSAWAWQGLAHARLPISDRVNAGLKYRYFSTLEFELDDSLGRFNEFEFAVHSLSVGVEIALGRRQEAAQVIQRPAPPAPRSIATAPPPPPPPPVDVSCNAGPYIAFFDWDEATITPEAAAVLNSAISAYRNCGTARVMLAGHTDTSGPRGYNQRLAERRNTAVRDYLLSRGISAARIAGEAFGESDLLVPTADGVREPQNRRVEVTYGPNAGM